MVTVVLSKDNENGRASRPLRPHRSRDKILEAVDKAREL